MTNVAVLSRRERIADALVGALRGAAGVSGVLRIAEPSLLPNGATIVFDPAAGTTPDLPWAEAALAEIARANPAHVVLISSAAVHAPHHQNPGLIPEYRQAAPSGNEIADAWLTFERSARERLQSVPELTVAVMRPATVLDGTDYFSRLLGSRLAPVYPGHDPTLQFLASSDLAGAVRAAVEQRAGGVFHVAPANGIPLRKALKVAGAIALPLPRLAQIAARRALAPLGAARPDQLRFIQYSSTVSGDHIARTLGFRPLKTSAQAIAEALGRAPRPDAAPHDEFGMDAAYIARYSRTLFRFLERVYWRIEVQGLEHIPRGRGVLTGVHRGWMPFDGVMTLQVIFRGTGRIPRFLVHPSLTKFPFLGDFMTKLGGVMACQENGDYFLERDELIGMYPEGIRGAFTMYRSAYKLGKFGRDEFVRMALRNRAPIVPFVTVGSAEIYPILGRINWSWFNRYTGWPFLPLTPTPVPLPSKWHTRFLPALHVEERYGPEAADDPAIVKQISGEVRVQMEAAFADMLKRRRSIFTGNIFTPETR